MEIQEIWKDIIGFEGRYQISNYGNVKSLKRKKVLNDYILKLNTSYKGYYLANLWLNGRNISMSVHRLVSLHFMDKRKEGYVIDHIDRNKKNNHISNLRYLTNSENAHNVGKRKTKTSSKYKGVYYDPKRNKYRASITCIKSKKLITLGRFNTENEAALKVNEYCINNAYQYYVLNIIN